MLPVVQRSARCRRARAERHCDEGNATLGCWNRFQVLLFTSRSLGRFFDVSN